MKLLSHVFLSSCLAASLCLAQDSVTEVDVAIVGGSATGSYAAVRLREDYKKSVLVIEKTNRLGNRYGFSPVTGLPSTIVEAVAEVVSMVRDAPSTAEAVEGLPIYIGIYRGALKVESRQPGSYHQSPNGGNPINYGVEAYLNRDKTAAFFKRFNVNLVNPDLTDYISLLLQTKNIDFNTGLSVNVKYGPVDLAGIPLAFLRYAAFAVKYQSWFENGYFRDADDIPSDLLLPFGEFLAKHDLSGALGIIRNLMWLADAINMPTWFVMAGVGKPQIAAFGLGLTGPSFKRPEMSSETLYDRVLDLLGDDVLLESTVVSSQRSSGDDGAVLTVQTPSDQRTVKAKRLLIAATPSPDNVGAWDLDSTSTELFGKFSWETIFVSVVNNTGLPSSVHNIRNTPNSAATYYVPQGTFVDAFSRASTGNAVDTDLWTSRVIGHFGLAAGNAKSLFETVLNQVEEAGTYDIAAPKVVAFADHGAVAPSVSADELRDGFYNKLYALQGQRNTFWTGLAWAPDYTPVLWDFTEKLFLTIVQGL